MKLLGGGGGLQLVCGRPTLALSSALVPETLSCLVCVDFGWLVVLGLRPFETVFQSISGRLPKRGRKRREKDR